MTDRELLARYTATGSEKAFAEMVGKHGATVYRTCLRLLGDPHAAEDAAQATFLVLVRKAKRLPADVGLADWLFWTARHCALNVGRERRRRAAHERAAKMTAGETSGQEASWAQVLPHLDAALAALPRQLREPVLLYYFERKTQEQVALEMGCPRKTVANRLSAALDRLRAKLASRGVVVSESALAGFMAESSSETVPAGIAQAITAACLGKAAAAPSALSAAEGAMKTMFWAKVKLVVSAAVAISAVGAGTPLTVRALSAGEKPAAMKDAPPAAAPAGRVVLSERNFWRKHYTFFPPSLSVKAAEAAGQPTDAESRAKFLAKTCDHGLRTAPPAADWKSPDFADGDWLLRRGRDFTSGDGRIRGASMDETSVRLRASDPFNENVGLVSCRGKFTVKDRTRAGKLWLSLTYRGGFVAYLNGKEVARANLPEGAVGPTTPADDYPMGAWLYQEDGGGDHKKGHYLHAFDKEAPWGLRERTFGPKEIPSDALRDGLNVLAIEIHRSDYPAEVARTKCEASWQRS